MKTMTASRELCVVHRGRLDHVFSGLGAVGLLGAAWRVGGMPAVGLAALGGWLLGRTVTGHRVAATPVECAVNQAGTRLPGGSTLCR